MKLKHISWLPAVIIMIVIFCFSSVPADTSSEDSLTIAENLLTIYENVTTNSYEGSNRTLILEDINHIVRKSSHFLEYLVLAFSLAFHLKVSKARNVWRFTLPVIISAIYAASDEYHQTFIPGRSGQISDVVLDTLGASAGMLLFVMVISLRAIQNSKTGIIRR